MALTWKFLSQYFLTLGTILGMFQFTFNKKSLKAEPLQKLRIYSMCLNTALIFLFPASSISILVFVSDDVDLNIFKMMGVVYLFELVTQNISYTFLVCNLVYKNSKKLTELINSGSELLQVSYKSFSMDLFWLIVGLIVLMEWICCLVDFMACFSTVNYNIIMLWAIVVNFICDFIIMFVGNLFFCAILCAANFYKSLNYDLKMIVEPLKTDNSLSHFLMIQISDRIDQKMILHLKIGRFVQDLNVIFSPICAGILLYSFATITGEFYTFYSYTRVLTEADAAGYVILSMYMVALQILVVFSFVYASSQVVEQIERTADILKIFLDPSVDDRLKNTVNDSIKNLTFQDITIYFSRLRYFHYSCVSIKLASISAGCLTWITASWDRYGNENSLKRTIFSSFLIRFLLLVPPISSFWCNFTYLNEF